MQMMTEMRKARSRGLTSGCSGFRGLGFTVFKVESLEVSRHFRGSLGSLVQSLF